MKYVILAISCIFLTGCSSVSLNKMEQTELLEYILYTNNIVELLLSKDTNKRLRLEPYKTRYRLILPIIQKINSNIKL